ncbi:MAG: hypothetical protein ACT4PL_10305 [Phycisphaerales bacterium]
MTTSRTLIPATLALAALAGMASATPLNWGNAAGGSAGTASNWSPNQVPVAADALTFNLPNTFTVTFPASTTSSLSQSYLRGIVTLSMTSTHTTSGTLTVGNSAGLAATAIMTAGTYHVGSGITVGNASTSIGTLTVEDEGTLLDTTGAGTDITIGSSGTGTLTVRSGATVRPLDDLIIGSAASGIGTVNVTGTGGLPLPIPSSTLDLPNAGQDLTVGLLGDGDLNVTTGGLVNADEIFVALNPGSTGNITVGGTGGLLNVPATINVDTQLHLGNNPGVGLNAGSSTLTINNGGLVRVTGTTRLGDPTGVGSTTLTINEGGTLETGALVAADTAGFLNFVGGTLRVIGGTFSPRNDTLALGTGGSPELFLQDGASSTLSSSAAPFEALVVGQSSGASMNVELGSSLTISAGDCIIGNLATASGYLTIDGSTMTLPASRSLIVGDEGAGFFDIIDSTVNTGSVAFSRALSADSRGQVLGTGATLNITGNLTVGGTTSANGGPADVSIINGTVNVNSASSDSVVVWGVGDRLVLVDGTLVANRDIRVQNGATFSASGASTITTPVLGLLGNSATYNLAGVVNGFLLLGSASSQVVLAGDLTVGGLNASPTGIGNSGLIEVGNHTLRFVGPVSALDNGLNSLHLGPMGRLVSPGALDVAAGRALSGEGTIEAPIDNSGTILAQNGGLTIKGIINGLGQGITGTHIAFDNDGGFTGSGAFSSSTRITLRPGSEIRATGNLTMGNPADALGVSSTGGRIAYDGQFSVTLLDSSIAQAASVAFPNVSPSTAVLFSATGLNIVSAGTVTGNGRLQTVIGQRVRMFGTIAPGSPGFVGVVSATGRLELTSTSTIRIDIRDGANHDRVQTLNLANGGPPVPTHIDLGGALVVTVLNGHTPVLGESHRIIETVDSTGVSDAQIFGDFASVSLPDGWIYRISNDPNPNLDGVYVIFCPIDFNRDGILSPDDLDEFITFFFSDVEAERALCDFNGDGFVEPGDLDEFITGFFQGC